jgi:hypothetical protein
MKDRVYTQEMGQPPMDVDMGSAKKRLPIKAKQKPVAKKAGGTMKYAKGGSIDGCAVKGKTKGKMY